MINGWWPMVLFASGLPKPLLLTTLFHLRSSLDTGWTQGGAAVTSERNAGTFMLLQKLIKPETR